MIEDLIIIGNTTIGSILTADYDWVGANPEGNTEYQWYVDGIAIEGATEKEYQALQGGIYVVAVLPIDNQGNEGTIEYSDDFTVSEEIPQPIEKEYMVKAYDKNFGFVKVIPMTIITNDISYSENINSGQGELQLNLNLPIDTDYLNDVKFIRVYVNSNNGLQDRLLYTGYLSKYSRLFSNNKENIQATFLSLFSLLSEIVYKDNSDNDEFTIEGIDPALMIKRVVDYFSSFYPGVLYYTNQSIINYGSNINVECNNTKCSDLLKKVVDGLTYHLYIGADGLVQFKPKPSQITHRFTYEKDITALTIPQDFEQVVNAVRVKFGYIGGNHTGITDRAVNQESIDKYGRKEETITNQNIYGLEAAEIYRDSILNKYAEGKQNVKITVNNNYLIENIHPGDTIKIMNLGLDINGLQISSVSYQYEQATIQLEYTTTLPQQIFTSNG